MKTGKNLIVLFAALLISFLSIIQDAEADCPDGWSADTVSNTYNGCDYINKAKQAVNKAKQAVSKAKQ